MAIAVFKKLKINEGDTLLTVNAPADFKKNIGELPGDVSFVTSGKIFNQVHWFVKDQRDLHTSMKKVLPMVKGTVLCWVYFPKGSSGVQTDLTRDKGWDELLAHKQFQWISLISFDDTWSTFGFRESTASKQLPGKKLSAEPAIKQYIDAQKKEVRLPDDVAALFKKHKKEAAFFGKLSYTNRKEYIEWIVSAKREETRQERLIGTIERLTKEWKNPRNQ